jgi:hypothetical protein
MRHDPIRRMLTTGNAIRTLLAERATDVRFHAERWTPGTREMWAVVVEYVEESGHYESEVLVTSDSREYVERMAETLRVHWSTATRSGPFES